MSMHDFRGTKALVTGASGFIGTALCERLRGAGAMVHAVSRQARTTNAPGLQWWRSDLRDPEEVRRMVETVRPDLVFHLASHVAGSRSLELIQPTFEGNLVAAVNMLTAVAQVGCGRVVLTGSQEEPQPDGQWPVPSSPYAAAKFAAAAYARMFHSLYQTPAVTLRLFMVYGPGQMDLKKLVPHATMCLLEGRAPELSSGVRRIDWVFVDDVVDAYLAAGVSEAIAGETIDIGSGELVTVRDIVERLTAIVGTPGLKPRFGAVPDRKMEQERRAELTRARALLGWSPKTTLDEGLRRTVDWYRMWLRAGRAAAGP